MPLALEDEGGEAVPEKNTENIFETLTLFNRASNCLAPNAHFMIKQVYNVYA